MRLHLITLLIILACVQVAAKGYAQRISLNVTDAPLKTILKSIEQQSGGYIFWYKDNLLTGSKKVTLDLKNASLKEALEQVFKDQPISYQIVDQTITLIPKEKVIIESLQQYPQNIRVSGIVTNEKGEPMAGVNISIKGLKVTATTDSKGVFSLQAEGTSILIFTFVGYQNMEVPINGQTSISVTMVATQSQLDEVQVIAYGTTTRRTSTGNVSTLKSEKIEEQPITNIIQSLSGRISGLQVTEGNGLPGTTMTVRIRGRNSIDAKNEPLYIVDGVPFNSASIETLAGTQGTSTPLNMIDPNNIEQIDVLKDADATAIYGSRGANGVILITTKKGKSGKTIFEFNANYGISKVARLPRMLNTQEYLQLRKDALANSNLMPTVTNAPDIVSYKETDYFDWQNWYMGGKAQRNSYTGSVSGGNQQTNFMLSGTYYTESTVRDFDKGFKRGNSHLSIGHTSTNRKFRVNVNIFYTADKNETKFDLSGGLIQVVRSMPNYPVYDNDGKYNWVNGVRNFLASFDAYVKSYTNDLNTSFDLSYSLLPNLEVKYLLGFNKLTTKQVRVQPSTSFMPGTTALPSSAFNNAYNQDLISEPQINYRVNVGKSNLNITAGATLQQNERNIETINVSNYTSDINLENPRFGTPAVTATKTPYRYLSVYSRVNYNVSDRYLLNISFRRDGSTRFGPSNKFGNFYSIGGGWLFYKSIDAFKYIKWLSFGKLRASYGLTGSDGIPDYKFKSLYSSSSLYGTSYTIIPSQVANKDFGWERTKKAEIGLDLGFLKDKIVVSAGFYRNRSDNQLVSYTLPSITGFTGYTANLPATIQNQGLELEIKTDNVTSRNFNWTTSLNFTIARNKLISFPGIESSSYGSSYVVGKSLNIVQRFNFLGINQNDGSAILEDVNKDNSYTQTSAYNKQNGDFIIAGSTDPKFFGGMGNTLSYKGLELDLFVQFVKQDGYNVFGQGSPSFGRNFNLTTYYLDYWKSPNDGSSLPKPLGASNVGLNNFFSSTAGFGDASFIRLKNVQVNYTLPNRVIKKLKIESVRVFIQGQNLLTFTKYKGYDPEQASSSSIVIPTLRTITAGIKCSL